MGKRTDLMLKFMIIMIKWLRDPKIDAIIISSPTSFHIEHINIALKAGKAIFCEKPVDLSFKSKIDKRFDKRFKGSIYGWI